MTSVNTCTSNLCRVFLEAAILLGREAACIDIRVSMLPVCTWLRIQYTVRFSSVTGVPLLSLDSHNISTNDIFSHVQYDDARGLLKVKVHLKCSY